VGTVFKGPIGEEDISLYKGGTDTFTRTTSSGYTQTLTKLDMGYFHVDWFGAVGDGITDDSAAIALAVAAVPAGGVLRFANKDYLFNVSIGKTMTIEGPGGNWVSPGGVEGKGLRPYNPSLPVVKFAVDAYEFIGITVRNLNFYGDTLTDKIGLQIGSGCWHGTIDNVCIEGFVQDNLLIGDYTDIIAPISNINVSNFVIAPKNIRGNSARIQAGTTGTGNSWITQIRFNNGWLTPYTTLLPWVAEKSYTCLSDATKTVSYVTTAGVSDDRVPDDSPSDWGYIWVAEAAGTSGATPPAFLVEKLTGWTNGDYDTFTTSGTTISSAINSAGTASASSNNFSVTAGKHYEILVGSLTFTGGSVWLTVHSGNGTTHETYATSVAPGTGDTRFAYTAAVTGTLARVDISSEYPSTFEATFSLVEHPATGTEFTDNDIKWVAQQRGRMIITDHFSGGLDVSNVWIEPVNFGGIRYNTGSSSPVAQFNNVMVDTGEAAYTFFEDRVATTSPLPTYTYGSIFSSDGLFKPINKIAYSPGGTDWSNILQTLHAPSLFAPRISWAAYICNTSGGISNPNECVVGTLAGRGADSGLELSLVSTASDATASKFLELNSQCTTNHVRLGYLTGGAWDTTHLVMGPYHLFYDASIPCIRYKNGIPGSETDGTQLAECAGGATPYFPSLWLLETEDVSGGVPYAGSAASIVMDPNYTTDAAGDIVYHYYITCNEPTETGSGSLGGSFLFHHNVAPGSSLIEAASTKSTPSGVDGWVRISLAGTTYFIPAYLSKTA
jgi:hypothetical protein